MFYITNTYRYAMLLVDKFFPEASIIYYYITGSTEEDLRKQMNSLGPFDLNGKPWDAYTQWDTHWNWIGKNTPSYQLDKSTVLHYIQVTFPFWIIPENVSPWLAAKWEVYIRSLIVHESGHIKIVVENLKSIRNAIENAKSDTEAELAAKAADNCIQKLSDEYEDHTGHGKYQGAIFP
jgi:predicted secreted Zn-dependent protease